MIPIVAYKVIDNCCIISSLAESKLNINIELDKVMDWLIHSHTTTSAHVHGVVWSLSNFAKALFSPLPESVRQELSHHPCRAKWGNYRLFFIQDKVLSVNKNGSEISFYSLDQYFPEDEEPDSLESLQKKADQLQKAFEDLGVTSASTLVSPIAAFSGHERLKAVQSTIPTIYDAPASNLEAYEVALQCTPREWVSNYQIGNFPGLWSYDVSSAYPSQAARLLDLRDCTFHRSTVMDDKAYYGFLVGDFTVYPDHPYAFCSPFMTDRGDGTLVNFTGQKKNYPCLLSEVRILQRLEMGEFDLKYGWFISPTNGVRPRFPFKSLMEDFYTQRGEVELNSYLLKRVMAGLIGKLLESHRDNNGSVTEYGKLYNPIYHALCTTGTRLQVFDFLVNHNLTKSELVHIGVDGVKSTRFIDAPAKSSLGRWRCSGKEDTLVLSPGAIASARRNFKGLGYADMMVNCLEKPNARIIGRKENPIDLRKLFVNQNRMFSSLPKTAADLIGSIYVSSPCEL